MVTVNDRASELANRLKPMVEHHLTSEQLDSACSMLEAGEGYYAMVWLFGAADGPDVVIPDEMLDGIRDCIMEVEPDLMEDYLPLLDFQYQKNKH